MSEEKENIIFGVHPIVEAIENGKEIDKILMLQGQTSEQAIKLLKLAKSSGIHVQHVPKQRLDRATRQNHQGVIAYTSALTYSKLDALLPELLKRDKPPLILLLDKITDVRNFGAICRSAECFGVDAVVIPTQGGAKINQDSIKTSAGALMKIPVCKEESLKYALAFCAASGLRTVACTEKSQIGIESADLTGPLAIIMGNEEFGISPALLKSADIKAKIPMSSDFNSLNVSVAAGVVLYETLKQRSI